MVIMKEVLDVLGTHRPIYRFVTRPSPFLWVLSSFLLVRNTGGRGDLFYPYTFDETADWPQSFNTCDPVAFMNPKEITFKGYNGTATAKLYHKQLPTPIELDRPGRELFKEYEWVHDSTKELKALFFQLRLPSKGYSLSYYFKRKRFPLWDTVREEYPEYTRYVNQPDIDHAYIRALVLSAGDGESGLNMPTMSRGRGGADSVFFKEAVFLGFGSGSSKDPKFFTSHQINGARYPMEIYMYFYPLGCDLFSCATQVVVPVQGQEDHNPRVDPLIQIIEKRNGLRKHEQKYLKRYADAKYKAQNLFEIFDPLWKFQEDLEIARQGAYIAFLDDWDRAPDKITETKAGLEQGALRAIQESGFKTLEEAHMFGWGYAAEKMKNLEKHYWKETDACKRRDSYCNPNTDGCKPCPIEILNMARDTIKSFYLEMDFQITWLLPNRSGHYYYKGQTPFPPCAKTNQTIVFETPIKISWRQMEALTTIPILNKTSEVFEENTLSVYEMGMPVIQMNGTRPPLRSHFYDPRKAGYIRWIGKNHIFLGTDSYHNVPGGTWMRMGPCNYLLLPTVSITFIFSGVIDLVF